MELTYYPDPVLKRIAAPVATIDAGVKSRVSEMLEIMYRENGVGLAAPQVSWSVRLFVTNPVGSEHPESERVFINPRVLEGKGEAIEEEGCLSIPEVRGRVKRHTHIRIQAQDLDGEVFESELEGLAARAFLHENDHLDGLLFVSCLSEIDKLMAKKTLKRLDREYRKKLKAAGTSARR